VKQTLLPPLLGAAAAAVGLAGQLVRGCLLLLLLLLLLRSQ
jgi:hypothetical protein